MKIIPKAAESFLNAPESQCRALLLYGPDAGLVRERFVRVRAQLLAGSHDPFADVELEEATLLADPARLADELLAMGLMASRRVISVQNATDKLAPIIREVAVHLHPGAFLLLGGGELSPRSTLRSWFEQEAGHAALACYHDEARDVQAVIQKAFAAAGVAAEREVVDYLSQQLGNDRAVTRQEIEKLITFAGEQKRLGLEDAMLLTDYNREATLDDIVQAVADRKLDALEATLQVQLREGVAPVAYLRALSRYFSRLYAIAARTERGESIDSVIASLKPKVFYKQEAALRRHADYWDRAKLAKMFKLLIAAELACKTTDMPALPASHRRLMQITQVR